MKTTIILIIFILLTVFSFYLYIDTFKKRKKPKLYIITNANEYDLQMEFEKQLQFIYAHFGNFKSKDALEKTIKATLNRYSELYNYQTRIDNLRNAFDIYLDYNE